MPFNTSMAPQEPSLAPITLYFGLSRLSGFIWNVAQVAPVNPTLEIPTWART
jgi:hypothetical protein